MNCLSFMKSELPRKILLKKTENKIQPNLLTYNVYKNSWQGQQKQLYESKQRLVSSKA